MTKKQLTESPQWIGANDAADIRATVLRENSNGETSPVRIVPVRMWYRDADNTLFITDVSDVTEQVLPLTKASVENNIEFKQAPDSARIVIYGARKMQELTDIYLLDWANNGSIRYFNEQGEKVMFTQMGFTSSLLIVDPYKPVYERRG